MTSWATLIAGATPRPSCLRPSPRRSPASPPFLASLPDALRAALGPERVRPEAPLSELTSFRIGGPAELLAEVRGADETLVALRLAAEHGVAVTLLGGGSNVLVSDRGVRGLVLRSRGGALLRLQDCCVGADAGVSVNGLVRFSICEGLQGLAAWAGTPGSVGGAIYGNAHFRGELISQHVVSVRLATRRGELSDVGVAQLGFGYGHSRLQSSGEVLLSAVFRTRPAEPAALRAVARASLAFRKATQPLALPSAGCVFKNPSAGSVPPGLPASAGALIEAAGLKGRAHGGARISPLHGNFVVNEGGATARDVAALIELARAAVLERFGVRLEEEIVRLGELE
jgi:UDP-N-acetylmuramate dehydrogenase